MKRDHSTMTKIGIVGAATAVMCLSAVGAVAVGAEIFGADSITGLVDTEPLVAAERTSPPVTTPAAPPPNPTTTPTSPADAMFAMTFDGNVGLDEFERGVWHRDDQIVSMQEWSGDHDLSCGSPATQRPVRRDDPTQSFYVCKDHMMTSVGDTSGYSIAWFSPKRTFAGATTVSIDVNSTNLGLRQWWEVSLVPAEYRSTEPLCPQCIANHSAVEKQFPGLPPNSFVFGTKMGGQRPMVNYENTSLPKLCNDDMPIDAEGCGSKPIRRTWTATDNQDGTVTLQILDQSVTVPGSFPDGEWKLVVKDHNYTPNKDGVPVGYTWHWDNVFVS